MQGELKLKYLNASFLSYFTQLLLEILLFLFPVTLSLTLQVQLQTWPVTNEWTEFDDSIAVV